MTARAAARAVLVGAWRRPGAAALVTWALTLFVAAVILYPIVGMIWRAFSTPQQISLRPEIPLLKLITNTLILAVGSGALALAIGALYAWLNERTDAGLGGAAEIVPLTPLLVPHLAGALGWVVLFEPRVGYVNSALRTLLGLSADKGPADIYTFPGLILITSLYLMPYSYLMVSAALRNLDPSPEEASRLCGAGVLKTLRRVTFPSVLPALSDAAILTLIAGVTMFSVPLVIGTGANIPVLSVQIFNLLGVYPPDYRGAILLSFGTLVVVQLVLFVRGSAASTMRRATISGKGFRSATVRLGRFRFIGRSLGVAYVVLAGVLPIAALLVVSLQPFWSGRIDWGRLGPQNYAAVFARPVTAQALFNSLFLGAIAATVSIILMATLVALTQFGKAAQRRVVDALATLPSTIPSIVLGVAFLFALGGPPFSLQGTVILLILAYVVEFMPYAIRAVQSALADVGADLPDASRVFGAGVSRTLRRIVLPLAIPGLVAGWIIVFVHAYSEVTVSALLSGVTNIVVGRLLIDFFESGSITQMSAVALVMTAVVVAPVLVLLRVSRSRFLSRVS